MFFTSTDRASTIPINSNIRDCQSGTWSAGQEKHQRNIYKSSNESIDYAKTLDFSASDSISFLTSSFFRYFGLLYVLINQEPPTRVSFLYIWRSMSLFPEYFLYQFPLSLCRFVCCVCFLPIYSGHRARCIESTCTSYVISFRMVFFYLVTTGWIFYISLCENSINQSIHQKSLL